MHFEFELSADSRNHFHFYGHGHFSLENDEVILDPSVLFYLTSHKIKHSEITYYLPDNLLKLIDLSKNNHEYQLFLKSFLTFFGYGFNKPINEDNWELFYQNINSMKIEPISLDSLKSEQKENYYENYLKMFSDHDFYILMSPKINFLGDCIAKILEFSRLTGKTILSKSRKLPDLLKEKIISLELPKSLLNILKFSDDKLENKSDYLNKMFEFPGGRTGKFFVSICLGVGGMVFPIPVIGGIGVAFIFIDP